VYSLGPQSKSPSQHALRAASPWWAVGLNPRRFIPVLALPFVEYPYSQCSISNVRSWNLRNVFGLLLDLQRSITLDTEGGDKRFSKVTKIRLLVSKAVSQSFQRPPSLGSFGAPRTPMLMQIAMIANLSCADADASVHLAHGLSQRMRSPDGRPVDNATKRETQAK